MPRKADFLKLMQQYLAELSIPPSALRNQGAGGVVHAAREYLGALPLNEFRGVSQGGFQKLLDRHTAKLQKALPDEAARFGAARKALNVFLRSVLLNTHLCEAYRFDRIEHLLELPLDSQSAAFLAAQEDGGLLPRWRGIKGLEPGDSRVFQSFALDVAKRHSFPRIYLEMLCRGELAQR